MMHGRRTWEGGTAGVSLASVRGTGKSLILPSDACEAASDQQRTLSHHYSPSTMASEFASS